MPKPQTFLIVGAGLAGAKAAQELREQGFDGRVVLVGEETERPYERPPLSKGYLTGSDPRDSIYVHDEKWYTENDVELLTGTPVAELDLSRRDAVLEGRRLAFDKVLLTTGASPRRLRGAGGDLDGVHYLRRVQDSDTLTSVLGGGDRRLVVIGGGWIGLEVAAAARGYGNTVTVVEMQSTVLEGVLGERMGNAFAELHRANGVDLRLSTGVDAIVGTSGRVSGVRTGDGEELPADLVVAGIGVTPNVGLAEAAGLDVDNGILADARLRSSHPDVFAAGDVANAFHPGVGQRIRVEHWANALKGGPAAARSMLGRPESYDEVPYFYTDQYDLGMEYSGYVAPGAPADVVIRGDLESRTFVAFWLEGDRVLAGMNVNVWDVADQIQALVRSRTPVDRGLLADADVPLDAVAGPERGTSG